MRINESIRTNEYIRINECIRMYTNKRKYTGKREPYKQINEHESQNTKDFANKSQIWSGFNCIC